MYKMIYATVLLTALVPLAGCGQSGDSLAQQQVDQLNELADAMEAKSEQAKIDAIQKRIDATKKAADDLNLSDDAKKKLAEKYGPELTKAMGRVVKVQMSQMQGAMQGAMQGMMQGMEKNMPPMPKMP